MAASVEARRSKNNRKIFAGFQATNAERRENFCASEAMQKIAYLSFPLLPLIIS